MAATVGFLRDVFECSFVGFEGSGFVLIPRRAIPLLVAGAALLLSVGCSAPKVVVEETVLLKGKLTKGGTPLTVDSSKLGDYAKVEISFVPTEKQQGYKQSAKVGADGSFTLATESGKPLPPGKYKVAVRQWEPYPTKDLLNGKYDDQKTPLSVTIAADTKHVEIDMDKPNG